MQRRESLSNPPRRASSRGPCNRPAQPVRGSLVCRTPPAHPRHHSAFCAQRRVRQQRPWAPSRAPTAPSVKPAAPPPASRAAKSPSSPSYNLECEAFPAICSSQARRGCAPRHPHPHPPRHRLHTVRPDGLVQALVHTHIRGPHLLLGELLDRHDGPRRPSLEAAAQKQKNSAVSRRLRPCSPAVGLAVRPRAARRRPPRAPLPPRAPSPAAPPAHGAAQPKPREDEFRVGAAYIPCSALWRLIV